MNIKELKLIIQDLPDDLNVKVNLEEVAVWGISEEGNNAVAFNLVSKQDYNKRIVVDEK